jgi:hypothetical protein
MTRAHCARHGRGAFAVPLGLERTTDLQQQVGSPYASPLIALQLAPEQGPLLVSWQSDVPSARFVRKPSEAQDAALVEPGGVLPILGLKPWLASRPELYSILCIQKPWSDAFEIFLFSWDSSRSYSFLSAGTAWSQEGVSRRLSRRGRASARVRLVSCRQLSGVEASCAATVWGAVFKVEKHSAQVSSHSNQLDWLDAQ